MRYCYTPKTRELHGVPVELRELIINIAHKISHGTIVVVVNNQSANSKIFLLLFDWMLTMTIFVPWYFLWAMVIKQMGLKVNTFHLMTLGSLIWPRTLFYRDTPSFMLHFDQESGIDVLGKAPSF